MTPALTKSFERDRYVVLRSLLKEPDLTAMHRYAQKVAQLGWTKPGDGQIQGTPCSYGDFMMEGLLTSLLPTVEQVSSLRVFPTYAYFRVYKQGDTLVRHTDRPSCEISLTLCLGYDGKQPWPINIEGPRGTSSVSLEAGDALLYRGIECPHWRCPLAGSHHAQVFLHYVDQHGPHAEWKFDKRSSLTSLQRIHRT